MAGNGAQLGDGHLKAAIAHQREDQFAGVGELRADGRGESETHGPEAAGIEPQPRLVEADQLRRPHLVLAHVGRNNGFALRQAVDFGHQVLRLDLGIGGHHLQRMLRFPGADLPPPGAARGGAGFVGGNGALGDQLVEPAQHALHIAHNGHLRSADLADFGGVDVHMDYFGVRREGCQAAGHAIVEAHAEGDQHVARSHRHIGGVAAVHARHADEIRMPRRQGAQPHEGVDRGDVGQFHQFAQLRGGAGGDDAPARINQRPLGFLDHLRGAADLAGVAFGEDLVPRQMNRRHRLIMTLAGEHILRDIHQHRTGPSAGGDIKCLVDGLRQVLKALHQEIVLGAGARDAKRVGLLKRVAADQLTGDLAGNGDDGNGVHQGVHQAGGQVGGAGARSGAADSRFAGGARVAFGREGGILFVAHQYVAHLVLIERIVEGKRDAARIAEHTVDTLADQAFQKHRGAVHQR